MYPQKIIKFSAPCGSVCEDFSFLLSKCESEYIMFCDGGGWCPEKIEATLCTMKEAQNRFCDNTPVLVHGGVIGNGQDFDLNRQKDQNVSLSRLLVQNRVAGNTVMINLALKNLVGEIPKECAAYDWWLALTACIFGETVFADKPLVYEKSGDTAKLTKAEYIRSKFVLMKSTRQNHYKTYVQARLLRQRFIKENVSPEKQKILNAYCNMSELGKLGRIRLMRKYGFKKDTKLRLLWQYIYI